MHIRCPHCQNAIEYVAEQHQADLTCPSCNSEISVGADETLSMVPSRGEMVAHFELVDTLGVGGFGSVHMARDTKLDRMVAIKLPRYEGMADKYLKNFFKEARSAAQIKHPNIVAVHEIGQDGEEGRVYIVSDLVKGVSLSERLNQIAMAPRKAAELTVTLLNALQAAHEAGVIHRDLKPANVLLDQDDVPYITDFGLAKREGGEMTVTARGEVLGTPAYMSPEQASGDGHKADARSDVYSVGVMLYLMLAGCKPFVARESRLLLHQVLKDEPQPPRKHNKNVPADLQTICLKAMEKDPAKRYQSAEKMAADLQRYLDGRPIQARPVSSVERLWRWARRNRTIATAAGVILLLSGALAAAVIMRPDVAEVHYPLVEIVTDPPGAEVAIAPIDPDSQEPIDERVILPEGTTPLKLELPPGQYLVVARKGKAFHEVLRRVPEDPAAATGMSPHQQWALYDDGSIGLPPVKLFEQPVFADKTALIEGGVFFMGKDASGGTPPHKRTVRSFLMMQDEVTFGLFRTVLKAPLVVRESGVDADAIGHVNWNVAVKCAELLGGRLPTEAEFEFAATNRGVNDYPWGDDASVITEWVFGPPRIASYDVRPGAVPIYGLYSNVAEWTSSGPALYPGTPPESGHLRELKRQFRIIRSGDDKIAAGEPDPATWAEYSRRNRSSIEHRLSLPGLGFRCVRSEKPRYLSSD